MKSQIVEIVNNILLKFTSDEAAGKLACPIKDKVSRTFTGTQLSNCAYYPGAKSGKKHALNKQYALSSRLRLLTRVYSIVGGAYSRS